VALTEHLCWTAFWNKRDGTWRVTENDLDSEYTPPALAPTPSSPT
jgi:hypothetical protein